MALKAELLWFELSSVIFWCSVLEVFLLLQMFWVWTTHTADLGSLWLHIFHLFRGLCGLWIIKKLPNSHDLLGSKLSQQAGDGQKRVSLVEMVPLVMQGAQEQMTGYLRSTGKMIKVYLGLTALCFLMDLISFFVGVAHFSTDDDHKAYFATVLICFAILYWVTDMYYLIWAVSVYLKLPADAAKVVYKATSGATDKLAEFAKKYANSNQSGGQPPTVNNLAAAH